MNPAEAMLKEFLAKHPEVNNGDLSLDEINRLLGEHQHQINERPEEDFDGVSREQMHWLLHDPMGEKSLIGFKQQISEESLSKVPLLALSDLLIAQIRQDCKLKLTAGGNLPVRICEYLNSQNLIDWKYRAYLTRVQEENIPYLGPLKHYLVETKIVRKQGNSLVLTKEGERIAEANTSERFIRLFMYVAGSYHWGNFYRIQDDGMYGQLGWAFSLYLLAKYGDVPRDSRFYSDKVMRAYFRDLYEKREDKLFQERIHVFEDAYAWRFFEVFAHWFGLVEISSKTEHGTLLEDICVKKTPLFDQLFSVL